VVLRVFKELQVRQVVQVQQDLLEQTLPLQDQQVLQEPQERLEILVLLDLQVQRERQVQTVQFLDLQVLLETQVLQDLLVLRALQVPQEQLALVGL
jgi:hypothetical protein